LPRNLLPGCEITGVRMAMLTSPFRPWRWGPLNLYGRLGRT
jgi:hypothetical protein